MPNYGPNNGTVPFTGYTNTLGTGQADTASTSGAVARNGLTNDDHFIARDFATRASRATKELLLTLLGAAAGQAALDTYRRVRRPVRDMDAQEYGGLSGTELVNLVNRNTTAADITSITALLTREPRPSYVVDASGNGGGNKAGF